MIFSLPDLPLLKWRLLALLAVLCSSAAAIMASKNFADHAHLERQAAQRQLDAARSQLASAEEDRKNMQAYTLEYGELLRRNLIGDGQRLEWIEGLEQIRKQNLVPDFKYTIAPQHPYIPPSKPDSGNLEFGISEINLRFELLHEGQLMDFFDALRTGVDGWFILDRCAMERSTAPDFPNQLKAECRGGWLTLKNRSGK